MAALRSGPGRIAPTRQGCTAYTVGMLRIVPLIASATEIVDLLGLSAFQVGRSHECDFPESVRTLPICTAPTFPVDGSSAEIDQFVKEKLTGALSIYQVFEDILETIQPTHIITQTQCKVCAVSLADVERALARSVSSHPLIVSLEPNSLADIWADIRRVAQACGVESRGETAVGELQARMKAIQNPAHAQRAMPRVACIEWHEPLMAAGNWVPEIVKMAHGESHFGTAGQHSPWMSWDALRDADPDIIISMPCGFDLERTEAEMYWLLRNPVWPSLRAVQNGQVYLTDGNRYMNRPGPGVVESLRILAEIFHPGAFEPTLEGVAWRHWTNPRLVPSLPI